MAGELRSILIGTAGLGVGAAIAALLTVTRWRLDPDPAGPRTVARLAVLVLAIQILHFGEEIATGFYTRFPLLLGLPPWSLRFFAWFNLIWIAIWIVSIFAMAGGRRAALFPLWFLGLACVANGLAHPLFAVRAAGYFPGLLTSLFLGAAGVALLRRLSVVTGSYRIMR